MATVVRREIRKRGFFGWLFLTLFFVFNAVMLLWIVTGIAKVSQLSDNGSDLARVGHNIGAGIAFTGLLILWVIGDVILGLCALLTRGRSSIITEETRP